ncbi:hypothetical protein FRC09_003234 [Ceratobasidium sp. 395]|nr:hypothetical protein FRC09_003234 [Ceratobasidium sp. 395]
MDAKPYKLTHPGEDPHHVPWVERFTTWTQRAKANPEWPHEACAAGWRVKLKINGHEVQNYFGQGNTLPHARADLVCKLEHASPPVMTLPLLPAYRA